MKGSVLGPPLNVFNLYVSWKPEPGALAVDAFTITCRENFFYAFPPFGVVGQVVAKVTRDQATGILVVPLWPTQPWFAPLLQLLVDHPRLVKPGVKLQIKGNPLAIHPLSTKLVLLILHVSGVGCKTQAYRAQLQTPLTMPGERPCESNTTLFYEGGDSFVVNGNSIPLLQSMLSISLPVYMTEVWVMSLSLKLEVPWGILSPCLGVLG